MVSNLFKIINNVYMFNLFRSKEEKLTRKFEKLYLGNINKIINEYGAEHPLTGMFVEEFIARYTKELLENAGNLSRVSNVSVAQLQNIIKNAAKAVHKKTIKQ